MGYVACDVKQPPLLMKKISMSHAETFRDEVVL